MYICRTLSDTTSNPCSRLPNLIFYLKPCPHEPNIRSCSEPRKEVKSLIPHHISLRLCRLRLYPSNLTLVVPQRGLPLGKAPIISQPKSAGGRRPGSQQ